MSLFQLPDLTLHWVFFMSVSATKSRKVAKTCEKSRCREPRAVLLVDGKRKRARTCEKHLSPRLRELLPEGVDASTKNAETSTGPKCGARMTQSGKDRPCKRPAGAGTAHPGYGPCKLHGGSTRAHNIAAAKQEAADAAYVMGMPVDVDPMDALLACVRIAAGEVAYATIRVRTLEHDEATVTFEQTEDTTGEYPESKVTKNNEAQLHVWIRTRHDAMDRLARFSKMAIDAGVAERKVEIAEKLGGMIGRMIQGVLGELDLTEVQQRRAPEIVQRHLTVIEASAHQLEAA